MRIATGSQALRSLEDDEDTTEASESDPLAAKMMYGYGAPRSTRLPGQSLDDRSVVSIKSTRSHKRRCEDYEDGYDDDDDVGESKALARAQRRASLKSSRRASMGSSKRRSSLSGNPGFDSRPRRASLNMSSAQVTRRVSLSSGVHPKGRRASASGGMYSTDYLGSAYSGRRASLSGGISANGFHVDKVKYTKPKAGRRASFSGDPYNIDPYAGHPQSPETVKSCLPAMSAEEIKAALSPVANKGINQDALARMNRRMSGQFHQDDEDSRQDSFQNLGYGYGYTTPQMPHPSAYSRRPSTSSRASSHRSRRLSQRLPNEIASSPIDIESDLENSESESDDLYYEKDAGNTSSNRASLDYGYGYGGKSSRSFANQDSQAGLDYESDARSQASSRASRRRNSCIIRPDHVISSKVKMKAELYESDADSSSVRDDDVSIASNRVSRRNSCCIVEPEKDGDAKAQDDLDDPDSLLSRSGFYSKQSKTSQHGKAKEPVRNSLGLARREDVLAQKHEEEEDSELLLENSKPVEKATVNVSTSFRQKPFTTALPAKPAIRRSSNALKDSIHRSWAELDFNNSESDSSSASESESDDSDNSERSYGSSLYEEPVQQEVDCFQQRARRRASLEAGCIDMREILDSPKKNTKLKKMANFTPAEGCKLASDFIVRCFVARLRHGITIMKHNRNRWSKSQYRVLYLLPDGKSLTWKPLEGEKVKGKRPILDLTKCIEVRHAWTKDPSRRKLTGTSVLRTHAKENMASKSLSLIFHKRTLDMSALSTDLCKVLLEGFSALCFRLKMEKEELGNSSTNDGCASSDDDFASTIYGGSTISMCTGTTNATTSTPISPWGL
ncbi:hypothetical protein FisN_8Lh127 [Fistulifera solaris]|uniref:PH domain-containing protein n=1 Tax=Fistulifera solaris TaxID=1519565 RepID=A0A1Z5JE19_FISSO|nr:hypothetical protein FisN_8Lh127 [Fistulifera solaris]|eukprot:GAX12028.1 hypothetical protein FisN_8Lh127 [Fistulifera solaris]